jgi:DNA-binding NarL/FixJ family response regulator
MEAERQLRGGLRDFLPTPDMGAAPLSVACAEGNGAKLRVLIVDAHKLLAEEIQPALEAHGLDVLGIVADDDQAASVLTLGLPDVVVLCMWTRGAARQPSTGGNGSYSHREGPPALVHGLTLRERQVYGLLVEGTSNKEIAKQLSIRSNTVRTHVQNLLAKLGVHTRLEAVTVAVRGGFVRPDGVALRSTATPRQTIPTSSDDYPPRRMTP